jgi:AcrR family transcriptional regulator
MATSEQRVLRADARRNLERILGAAREVLAERGNEASVAEIAERAGVGTATIFRRFPTKDALVSAVLEQRMAELVSQVGEALTQADAGKAFRSFMRTVAEYNVHDRCFCEATGTDVFQEPGVAALVEEFVDGMEALLERAQAAGAIRTDVTAVDALVLVFAVAQSAHAVEHAAPDAWRRYLDLVLDGLRPEGAHRLSRRAPTLAELERAKQASRSNSSDQVAT